jgi:glycosyltransferase involved in cell wall biosynthesis
LNRKYNFKSIFYFNGLPPVISFKKNKTFAYFQNTTILKNKLKRLYFKFFQRNIETWIFQTQLTRNEFLQIFTPRKTLVIPFFPIPSEKKNKYLIKKNIFFYPTSNRIHKNNNILIETFKNLYHYGIEVKLELTLKRQDYCGIITPNIIFLGQLSRQEVLNKYVSGCTMIHPSVEESFGLVLIEACQYDLNIITSDLPYVFQIIIPDGLYSIAQIYQFAMYTMINNNHYAVQENADGTSSNVFYWDMAVNETLCEQ